MGMRGEDSGNDGEMQYLWMGCLGSILWTLGICCMGFKGIWVRAYVSQMYSFSLRVYTSNET